MKFKKIFVTFLILFTLNNTSMACELTDEYKAFRNEVTKSARDSFNQCTASVSQVQYWYAFTQCIKERDDKKIGGTCGHIAGHNQKEYKTFIIDANHCNTLRSSSKEVRAIFDEQVKKKGITKCKVT